jgi:RNA polymerase subunit RPABC4/transcription elongation factor Spt4
MAFCSSCETQMKEGARFCPNCGWAAPTAPVQAEPLPKPIEEKPSEPQCKNCGTALKEGAAFCPECGTKTEAGAPPPPQVYQQPVPQTPAAVTQPQTAPSPAPAFMKMLTKRNVLIAAGVVVALIAISIFVSNSNANQTNGTPNITQTVTVPGNLRVTQTEASSVSLEWDSVGTGVSYQIYNGTENNPANSQLLGSIDGNVATITQLTAGTAYYFWVTAVKDGRESGKSPVVSARTAAAPMTYKIGDMGPAGGIVFYDKGNNSDGWRYLEAAPVSTDREPKGFYAATVFSSANDRRIGAGKENTRILMGIFNQRGDGNDTAPWICDRLEINGVSDWYQPSIEELRFMYTNLYRNGKGGFMPQKYWSSTYSIDSNTKGQVYCIDFATGQEAWSFNSDRIRVRAIRWF